jgi:conjugal transfer pilus assembly protein TraK
MPATKHLVGLSALVLAACPTLSTSAIAQAITALPDQTSRIRLSNHDINHVVCQGGDIDDVKFSAEKQIAVEKGGSDAWIKFLVKESDDNGSVTRTYVTSPSEFFVSCNGAVYPLYAEPADIPAQTVVLARGTAQRAKANADLMGPLADEERAVSITMAMLQDRVPASFSVQAPAAGPLQIGTLPGVTLEETNRIAIDGAGLSASEYRVRASQPLTLDERSFLVSALGANIFAVTLDATELKPGEAAHLVIVRRGAEQ